MVNPRRFLGASGFGMLARSAGLQNGGHQGSLLGDDLTTDKLQRKTKLKPLKNRLLGYLPYTEHAEQVAYQSTDGRARYGSIAVSCHKFFGFPSPAGLFITSRSLYDEFNIGFSRIHNPEYIHQVPGTIT